MRPLAADDPMTLRSAAVGDAAAAMKGGLSLSNQGEAGCGRACAKMEKHAEIRRAWFVMGVFAVFRYTLRGFDQEKTAT